MKKRRVLVLMCIALVLVISTVLAACNKPVTYTVTFSGDGIETITKTVEEGKTVTAPTDISKEGYDAVWQLNGEDYDFSKAVNSDLTLTLKWVGKKYTVTLNAGAGTVESSTVQVTFGEPFDLGVATTQEEKQFEGWAVNGTPITNSDGAGLGVWNIAADTTVTAIWKDIDYTEGFSFTELADGTYSISAKQGYTNYRDTVIIPSVYNDKPVTVIGAMKSLTSYEVKVPASIKTIGASAFAGNTYVEIVDLSDFSGNIADMAFYDSEIKMIDLGKTTAIGKMAFKNTPLSIVAVPATVTSLGDEALLSLNIMEIGFASDIPTLGNNVFGDGRRDDGDSVTIIASTTAWEKLIGQSIDGPAEEINAIITEKTGLEAATMRHYSEEELAASIAEEGILREISTADDKKVVYRGFGLTAVFYDYNGAYIVEMYEGTHLHRYLSNGIDRETYLLNYENRTVAKVEKNEKGETIYQNVLYDYQGDDIVYYVPENVTRIAGGAAFNNSTMRFAVIGDNVTEIGPFAFFLGRLFGVSFGENLTEIGDYAFFNQNYLQEITFYGTTAPTIGEAAFCCVSMLGIVPVTIMNDLTQYTQEAAYIYTPLQTYGSWPDYIAPCQAYVDAFNESLATLDNLPQIGDANDPDSMETVSYKTNMMKQLATYGINMKDKQYEAPFGTITMTGTHSGFAFVTFGADSGYTGNNYVFYSLIPGYGSGTGFRKLQVYTGNDAQGINQSFIVYGEFADGKFSIRGTEAGSYGELGKNILALDGFGKYVFYGEDGTTTEGAYTLNGTTITFDGMSQTGVFNESAKTVTLGGEVMTALGDEAGVYYDVNNAAKLTLDGKAYKDGTISYSGKLTLIFKEQTVETGYIIDKTYVKFLLNGTEKSWDYSRTSEDIVSGYYGNYADFLKFKVVENTVIDTFTNAGSTLSLDGYYTATIDGNDVYYRTFGESDSIMLFINDEIKIAYLNMQDKTFSYATAPEAGKWYVTTSANYAWYFDGNGNLLYFSGDEYVSGTYEYNSDTKELSVVYDGQAAFNNEKGMLDLEAGVGSLVYAVGTSNSYVAISKEPFNKYGYSYYVNGYAFIAAVGKDGSIVTTNPYFYFAVSGNSLFIYTNGNPVIVKTFEGELIGKTIEFEYTVVKEGTTITATYVATFNDASGTPKPSIVVKDEYYNAVGTVKSADGATEYTVSWIDETHVVIWTMGSWGGNVLVSGTVEGGSAAEFTVGDYKVTGYGTANAKIEEITAEEA